MNASGMARAMPWVARQPVQCAGTSTAGLICCKAAMVCGMIGSKGRAGQVEAAQHGINLLDARQHAGLAQDIYDARVSAAGYHHQPFVAYIDDRRLVIVDPGIGLPLPINFRLLVLHARLEVGGALNLPRHKHGAIDQERWAALDQQRDALTLQVMQRGWWQVQHFVVIVDKAAFEKSVRVQQDGHAPLTKAVEEAVQPVCMVGMTMTDYDSLHLAEIHAQHVDIMQRTIRRDTRIEQNGFAFALVDDGYQRGDAMFSAQLRACKDILA